MSVNIPAIVYYKYSAGRKKFLSQLKSQFTIAEHISY